MTRQAASVLVCADRLRRMNNALLVRVILARIARDPRFKRERIRNSGGGAEPYRGT